MAGEQDLQHAYYRQKALVRELRKQVAGLEKERESLAQDKARYAQAIRSQQQEIESLQSQPQMTPEDVQLYQSLVQERAWQDDMEVFKSALEDVIHPEANLRSMLAAIGYNPLQHQGLTQELVQSIYEAMADSFPRNFREETAGEEPDQDPEISAEPVDNSQAGTFKRAFEAGTMTALNQPTVQQPHVPFAERPSPQPPQQVPQQFQAQPGTAQPSGGTQQPNLGFKGFGQAAGRGGPSPTKVPTVGAHLRDPAWIARNQGAIAQAISEGSTVVNLDSQ